MERNGYMDGMGGMVHCVDTQLTYSLTAVSHVCPHLSNL